MSKRLYFDYAATTPMAPAVIKAMQPYFSQKFGNPSSLHSFGQEAVAAVDISREKIAKSIGADFNEVIFTGSATEANNLALRGVVKAFSVQHAAFSVQRSAFPDVNRSLNANRYTLKRYKRPRIIISAIEHESILETARDLEKEGVEIIYLPVNREGIIDLKALQKNLNERTILVSIMYANNEIGTVQPIAKIAEIIQQFKIARLQDCKITKKYNNSAICNQQLAIYPLLHTDAVQAFQFLDCDVNKLGVDLMTLSAHKIYGPKGIGLLYINSKLQNPNSKYEIPNSKHFEFRISNLQQLVMPIVVGGGQEFGLRSGTENVAGIVGFAKAVEIVSNSRELENKRINKLSSYFWQKLKKIYPKAQINGTLSAKRYTLYAEPYTLNALYLPNILNIYFPGHSAQDLLIKFDLAGIAVSSGSACSTRSTKISHVLTACDLPEERIKSSVRFSFGRFTTKEEIGEAIKRIKSSVFFKVIRN